MEGVGTAGLGPKAHHYNDEEEEDEDDEDEDDHDFVIKRETKVQVATSRVSTLNW